MLLLVLAGCSDSDGLLLSLSTVLVLPCTLSVDVLLLDVAGDEDAGEEDDGDEEDSDELMLLISAVLFTSCCDSFTATCDSLFVVVFMAFEWDVSMGVSLALLF